MRFVEIAIQNFMSFGVLQTIPLAGQGLVAIFGQNNDAIASDSNGAGKSTIMEAIVWVLWGDTLRGYRSDEVVNKLAGKDCLVSLTIEEAGKSYVITRTRKMSKVKHANDLTLTVDGVDATAGINADTQESVNTIIGMDQNTFIQSVLLSHGTKPFSELTDAAQKEVLDDILQINKFAKAREVVSKRLKERQQSLAYVSSDISRLEAGAAAALDKVVRLTASLNSHAAATKSRRLLLFKKGAHLLAQAELLEEGDSLTSLLSEATALGTKIAEKRKVEGELHAKAISELQLTSSKKSEVQKKIAVANSMIDERMRNTNVIVKLVGVPCATCKRPVSADEADAMLDAWKLQIEELQDAVDKLQEDLEHIDAIEQKTLIGINKQKQELSKEITELLKDQNILTARVQQRSSALQVILRLENDAFSAFDEAYDMQNADNPYEDILEDAKIELKDIVSKKEKLSYRKISLDLEISHLLFWDKGFGNQGVKSFIIEGVIPFLNDRAQYYANILSDGDLTIQFSTQKQLKSGQFKEEFQVLVKNKQGAEVYKGNSAGERRRIDTAVGWALGDLAATRAKKPIRFKALDEPFESLDETGEDSVVKLLHSVVDQYETIMVITHSDHLRNQFPKTLVVSKNNGSSSVKFL